ncbi:hypothetical protein ACFOZ7_13990 [Natribaculum luteum]|uniref:Uncharacterized protein n=1 Tax=Natribaculum luteum TaxID=1586232 RepID=A0ABD5P1A8_9EURY|nr:hypothetical protein [Natribaculum luteum]
MVLPYWVASVVLVVVQLRGLHPLFPPEDDLRYVTGLPFGIVENVPLNVVSGSHPFYVASLLVPSLLTFYLLTKSYLLVGARSRRWDDVSNES